MSVAAHRRLDLRHVDFRHRHHGVEGALGHRTITAGVGLGQHPRGDLPGQAPAVLAPATFAGLAAIADDRIPLAGGFGLVLGHHLERERLVRLEGAAAVQADAGNAHHGEFDGQHVALFPEGKSPGA